MVPVIPIGLLVNALVAYSVHEHQLGYVRRIDIRIDPDRVVVHDDGRGIGLDREGYVEDLLATLVGQGGNVQLHGVGLSIIAALTPALEVASNREGTAWKQAFAYGVPIKPAAQDPGGVRAGTRITLVGVPAPSEADVSSIRLRCKVWEDAHPGLTFVIRGEATRWKT